jgi:hypothetical protein
MIEADQYGGKSGNVISHCPRHTGWVCALHRGILQNRMSGRKYGREGLGYIELITKFKISMV